MVINGSFVDRRGDTLIEVTLAIGIFSMVAIAAVSVINASVSSTQGILENTLAREEINAQAEALRFIQAAYAAEDEVEDANQAEDGAEFSNQIKYAELWSTIAGRAVTLSEDDAAIVNYSPSTCAKIYEEDDSLLLDKMFAINTMALSVNDADKVVVTPSSAVFRETSTYPQIRYKSEAAGDKLYDSDEFLDITNGANYDVTGVEGIFILAVNDSAGTTIVSGENGGVQNVPAYIDFYIRSCWYAINAERPSTISTVIRLYNPDAVKIQNF